MSNFQIAELNYIRHLNAFFSQIKKDTRLSATHISLYMALFQYWNFNRFQNPFPVYRDNILQLCKIGSKNTYHKCIKELHLAGYITYHRSFSKFQPVKISLTRLDIKPSETENQLPLFNETNQATMNTKNNTGNVPDSIHYSTENNTTPASNPGQTIKPNIQKNVNSTPTKNLNQMKNINPEEKHQFEDKSKLPSGDRGLLPGYPQLSEVENFFRQHNYSITEAQKFFHYNNSKNWMISEYEPIKNWQSLAHKWIINIKNEKIDSVITHTIQEALEYLYKRYLEGGHIHKMLIPEFCDYLELELHETIMKEAIQRRINQLSGSNERSENQLWQAYMTEDNKNDLLIKDQPNLLTLAKKLAVLKHFQKLKQKGKKTL